MVRSYGQNLSGQVALVTGASSGVGRAIALALAEKGVKLCLVGRYSEKLKRIIEPARPTPSENGLVVECDLSKESDIDALIKKVKEKFSVVNMIIHSAGLFHMGEMDRCPAKQLDEMYQVNVRAPYKLTRDLIDRMQTPGGQIVFMNSSVGLISRGGIGAYAATKHALKAIADSVREEVNSRGIRVLSLFLGRTATPMQEKMHQIEGKTYSPNKLIQPQDIAQVVVNNLELPWTTEVTNITVRPMEKA